MKELRDVLRGPNISIGQYTYAGSVVLRWPCPVTIGKFCSFASDIEFVVEPGHYMDCTSTFPFDNIPYWLPEANTPLRPYHKGLEVNIGNDVWVGCGARIMHNAPIGDGAVIGAYSVVRSPVRPYAIVRGNPAREVRRRFDDETVEALLEIKWWDWPESVIRANMKLITSPPDIEGLRCLA